MFRFRDGRQGELVPSAPAPLVAFVLVVLLLLSAGALAAQESGAAEVDPAGMDAGLFAKQVLANNVRQVHAVVAADFDGDGDNDFAATDYVNHQVVYFRKDGNGYTRTLLDGNLKGACLLYTSPSPRDRTRYRMPSSA